MNKADWVEGTRQAVAAVTDFSHVEPFEQWLTDGLLEIKVEWNDPSVAVMRLLASPYQLFFFAGCGTRLELDRPEDSWTEAVRLAKGVAAGGLTERVGRFRIRFAINLPDGEVIRGSSCSFKRTQPGERGTHCYAPYPAIR